MLDNSQGPVNSVVVENQPASPSRPILIAIIGILGYIASVFIFIAGLLTEATGIGGFVLGVQGGQFLVWTLLGSAICLAAISSGYWHMKRWAVYLASVYLLEKIFGAIVSYANSHSFANVSWAIDLAFPLIVLLVGFIYIERMPTQSPWRAVQFYIGAIAIVTVFIAQIILVVTPVSSPLTQAYTALQSNTLTVAPTSTVGWQTYSHTADQSNPLDTSFSFQYPSGWIQKTTIENGLPFISVTNPQQLIETLLISLSDNSANESFFNDAANTSFVGTDGLVGEESNSDFLPTIYFDTQKRDASGSPVLLEFSVDDSDFVPIMEGVAKTATIAR